MKIIKPSTEILSTIDGKSILKSLELKGRVCYKSEGNITDDSCYEFIRKIIARGHESVIEHEFISVRFICDRGVSHELVRHRLASFSQESTRYCNYTNGKDIEVIKPIWLEENHQCPTPDGIQGANLWGDSMFEAEKTYNQLISIGWSPQQARSVLPNSLKTDIVVTANLREWRTIFKQRTSSGAHPQMQELMRPLLLQFIEAIPVIFDDIPHEW